MYLCISIYLSIYLYRSIYIDLSLSLKFVLFVYFCSPHLVHMRALKSFRSRREVSKAPRA